MEEWKGQAQTQEERKITCQAYIADLAKFKHSLRTRNFDNIKHVNAAIPAPRIVVESSKLNNVSWQVVNKRQAEAPDDLPPVRTQDAQSSRNQFSNRSSRLQLNDNLQSLNLVQTVRRMDTVLTPSPSPAAKIAEVQFGTEQAEQIPNSYSKAVERKHTIRNQGEKQRPDIEVALNDNYVTNQEPIGVSQEELMAKDSFEKGASTNLKGEVKRASSHISAQEKLFDFKNHSNNDNLFALSPADSELADLDQTGLNQSLDETDYETLEMQPSEVELHYFRSIANILDCLPHIILFSYSMCFNSTEKRWSFLSSIQC